MSQVFSVDQLVDFMTRTYVACGMPAADARSTAEMMIEADLLGSDAHGIFRLPQYVKRIRAGGFNLHPQIRIERETVATALIDGDNAMGHLVMRFAAETAIAKAKVAGVAWVGLHHGNHAGAGAVFATVELLIQWLDENSTLSPQVVPGRPQGPKVTLTVYVDDVGLEAVGKEQMTLGARNRGHQDEVVAN